MDFTFLISQVSPLSFCGEGDRGRVNLNFNSNFSIIFFLLKAIRIAQVGTPRFALPQMSFYCLPLSQIEKATLLENSPAISAVESLF